MQSRLTRNYKLLSLYLVLTLVLSVLPAQEISARTDSPQDHVSDHSTDTYEIKELTLNPIELSVGDIVHMHGDTLINNIPNASLREVAREYWYGGITSDQATYDSSLLRFGTYYELMKEDARTDSYLSLYSGVDITKDEADLLGMSYQSGTITYVEEGAPSVILGLAAGTCTITATDIPVEGYDSNTRYNVTIPIVITNTGTLYHHVLFVKDQELKEITTVADHTAATAPEYATPTGYHTVWDKDFSDVTSNLVTRFSSVGNIYEIQFDANGGSGQMNSIKATYDKNRTLPGNTFTRKGYSFLNWNLAPDNSDEEYANKDNVINLSDVQNDVVTLYAQWSLNKYSIKYYLNGGKNNSKNPSSYTVKTSTITLKNPTKKGYTFLGWYKDSKFKTKVTKISKGSTGNVKLYAKWKKNK